ncbi:hypothetical protein GCM10022251_37750 [Phytohabitans flavus]|uniref:DUF2795 domain-containing protein n=1 Tax=Phytohabitans flavus TaxID=1076124 RepID=A0A6F8XVR5_9ACTN|nr:hypothetical protein [Phytohabitans flavus]BCB77910.1 hypothetical protein Pflav_043200 [Phytohabitans flavus]
MTDESDQRRLSGLLDSVFAGQERVTRDAILRHAAAADLPADLSTRLDGLPEGEYALDEAAEALNTSPYPADS